MASTKGDFLVADPDPTPEPEDETRIRRSNRRQITAILIVVAIFGGGAVVELVQRLLLR